MWTYQIISKQLSKQEQRAHKRRRLDPKDPDFRVKLFERVLATNPFKKGNRVRVVGTEKKGLVTKIITDINQVNWVDHKPHFIELCMDDGEFVLSSPFQITRKRA